MAPDCNTEADEGVESVGSIVVVVVVDTAADIHNSSLGLFAVHGLCCAVYCFFECYGNERFFLSTGV